MEILQLPIWAWWPHEYDVIWRPNGIHLNWLCMVCNTRRIGMVQATHTSTWREPRLALRSDLIWGVWYAGAAPLISISNISWSCCWMNKYVYTYIYIYTHYIWVVSCNPPSRYLLMIARCHYLLSLLLLAGHLALGCWLFIQSSWWMLTKKSHRIPWVARSYTLQLVFHSPQKYSFCCITCHVCWQPPNSCWSKTLFAGCCFVAQSRNISDLFRLIQWQLKFLIDVETPFADHFPRVSPWVFHICPHLR